MTLNKGKNALLGFLLDGFPVYGPEEGDLAVTNSELDAYHGHEHATEEYPGGIYHYHITEADPSKWILWNSRDGYSVVLSFF